MPGDSFTCTAALQNLDSAISFIEELADRSGLAPQKKFSALVVVEEAFVNICHHAYPAAEGDVSISCSYGGDGFVIEISDTGGPFDLLSLPDPDTTSELQDRQIGGLGVHFIRTMTDHVSYRREDGRNILRLQFCPGQPQG